MPSKQKQDKAGRIPKGWRKLRAGTARQEGDKYGLPLYGLWMPVSIIGERITANDIKHCGPYIRRQPTRKK